MPRFLALACASVLASLILGSAPAFAHAVLVSSDPSDGASLTSAPHTVTFTFNENVGSPAYIVVTAPDGTRLKTSTASVLDHTISAKVAASDMKGTYSVAYRVVSTDGHPIQATARFTVTTGRTVTQVEQPASGSFVHRHRAHLIWGAVGAVVALSLLLAPLRGKHD